MKTTESQNQKMCTFWIDKTLFGIDVDQVQEVIRSQPMTPVPLSSQLVKGLINLRGQIVTAMDLRVCLNLPPCNGDKATNVIVRYREGIVSLLVDEIGDVVDVEAEWFEPPPETMSESIRKYVVGAYKLEDILLVHLDSVAVIEADKNASSVH